MKGYILACVLGVILAGCGDASLVAPTPAVRVKATPVEFVGPAQWVPPCLVACGEGIEKE